MAQRIALLCFWLTLGWLPPLMATGDSEAKLLLDHGRHLAAQGKTHEALPFYQQGIDMLEASLERPNMELAAGLRELAGVYRSAGRSQRAEAELSRAIAIFDRQPEPKPKDRLLAMSELAELLTEQGRLSEAESLHHERLTSLRRDPKGKAPAISATLTRLGLLADLQGRVDEAAGLYRQAIEPADRDGFESRELAAALSNLASVVIRQEALVPAEALYRRAIDLRSRLLGSRHWLTAADQSSLADLLLRLDRLEEARPLADRAASLLAPYCSGLNAEDSWSPRDARQACRETEELRQRLTRAVPGSRAGAEPPPQAVSLHRQAVSVQRQAMSLQTQADGRQVGGNGYFRVQVSARQQRQEALRDLADMQNRFPRLLSGVPNRLEVVDLGEKGTWYRLQFGNMETYAEAQALCLRLKRAGLPDCWVAAPPAPATRER